MAFGKGQEEGQFYHHPPVKGERKLPPVVHLAWAIPTAVALAIGIIRVIGTSVQGPIP